MSIGRPATLQPYGRCQQEPGGYRSNAVEQRLDVITLAVADLELALAFYRRLGLESKGIVGTQ